LCSLTDTKVAGFLTVIKTLWQTLLDGRDDDSSTYSWQTALPRCLPPLFTANFILMLERFKLACRYSHQCLINVFTLYCTVLLNCNHVSSLRFTYSVGSVMPRTRLTTCLSCFPCVFLFCVLSLPPDSYAIQHIWCLSQARINWEGCGRKGIRHTIWGMMEVVHRWSSRIVGAFASIIFPTPHKIQNDDRLPQHVAPAHPGSPRQRPVKR